MMCETAVKREDVGQHLNGLFSLSVHLNGGPLQSVYGLQNDIRSHSPTHTPAPEVKEPTEEEIRDQIQYWQAQLDRHRLKMSKVAE
ncbi:unnamed protein product, partial [Coregonus sp. 'balchen']